MTNVRHIARWLLLLSCTGLLAVPTAACRSPRASRMPPARRRAAPPPADVSRGAASHIVPGVSLRITVFAAGTREFEEPAKRVSEGGDVILPLLGRVPTQRLTLEAFAAELTNRYRKYLVEPQVLVEFVEPQADSDAAPWGSVTVLGRVNNPGRIRMPPTQDLTVSGAIQQAGGLASSAKEADIRVSRQRPDGKVQQIRVNLHALGVRGDVKEDLTLQPGDVVYVPESIL